MNSEKRVRWGIIGTGNIARKFAGSLPTSRTGQLNAVASRTQAAADAFAEKFPRARAFGSYEAMLADPDVEAVYISTPHPMHVEWVIRAAHAGKHILCEKPLAMNHAEAMQAAEAARQNGVFLMEAFMYRCHPQTARVLEIIQSGRLGTIRLIEASFAFGAGYDPKSRLFNNDLGGGAILDVGCYCMSMTRLVAGAVQGKPFAEPTQLKALGNLADTGVDVQAQALLEFSGGLQARLITGLRPNLGEGVTIAGSEAVLRIPSPWFADHPVAELEIETNGKVETIKIKSTRPLYSLEIDEVGDHLSAGEAPAMPIDDSLGNMAALDRWRHEIGLTYKMEELAAPRPKLPSLKKGAAKTLARMRVAIPGLDPAKRASRMVLGTMLEGAGSLVPHAFALYDYFVEHGGNIFDTAYIYAGGWGERTLGEWMRQRGVRDELTLVVKGAHPPCCDPKSIQTQLTQSLERLQIEKADIYMMHRDNPDVPVGEFVEAMNAEARAGRIGIFGGSNWTLERIDAANDYAREKGLQGFGAVSNQFSLARMVEPVWSGCVSSSDVDSRAWLARKGIPLFAWSSQARGFFINGARDNLGDPELARIWYSEDNFKRLERVKKLAKVKKTEPVHIAAAYVLQQPFPAFALIGPRKLSELASSFKAFEVDLTPEEMAWLNLESDSR